MKENYSRNKIEKKELFERLLMIEWRLSALRTMIENRREGFHIAAQISSTLHALESVAKDIRGNFVDDCSSVEMLLWKENDELAEDLLKFII